MTQLVTRFKGTHEIVESFYFLNSSALSSSTEKDINYASYDFVIKYTKDISTGFTRQISRKLTNYYAWTSTNIYKRHGHFRMMCVFFLFFRF